jgi:hypothetical protein
MVKINLKALDRDIFIQGDDVVARTIQIGQTVTQTDDVVVDSQNWSVNAAGNASFAGTFNATGNSTIGGTLAVTGTSSYAGLMAANGGISSSPITNSEVFGSGAGNFATATGTANTIIGKDAGAALTTGPSNVFIGYNAGTAAQTLATSTLIGRQAGESLVTGTAATAIGYQAMQAATNDGMTAIGSQAMLRSNGDNNLAIGTSALLGSAVTEHTGQYNIAIGAGTLQNIEGNTWNNTAIGGASLQNLTTAIGNTCIGRNTGLAITTGGSNVFIGNATGDTTTTGSSNILIGSGLDTTAVGTVGELRIHYAGGSNVPIISADMVSGKAGCNILPADVDATWHIKTDSADAIDSLRLEQLDVSENFIAFESTSAASTVNPLTSYTTGNTVQGHLRVDINGTARWIRFYDAPTS